MSDGIKIRRSSERGLTETSWLRSYHTFSFGQYYDPNFMGFRALRVINDDTVVAGAGFPSHPHRNMEILTYVLSGTLAHQDSTGVTEAISAGGLQRMTAGRGIIHSEFNGSKEKPVHFLQIWIEPSSHGISPSHGFKNFSSLPFDGNLRSIASGSSKPGSLHVNQDVEVYLGKFSIGDTSDFVVKQHRHVWIHVAYGKIRIDESRLLSGDGFAVSGATELRLIPEETSEILVFDLA